MSNVEHDEHSGRLYTPCPKVTSKFKTEQMVVTCDFCGRFYSRCCWHMEETCHFGIAFGTHKGNEDTFQFSIPVDDRLDP
ncbi:hypothetical protein OG21DRAFT_1513627 [Imleria badia]|nr:hypothetical protein OG21DRAFT_1513627 [Imleria badia]